MSAARRYQLNPCFERVSGGFGVFRGQNGRVLQLTEEQFRFISRFQSVVSVEELAEGVVLFEQLVEQGVLVEAGATAKPYIPILKQQTPCFVATNPWSPLITGENMAVVLGAPCDAGTLPQYPRGTAGGPRAIRAASLGFPIRRVLETGRTEGYYDADRNVLVLTGIEIYDAGDLEWQPFFDPAEYRSQLTGMLREIKRHGARPLLLGGDHSLTLAAIEACSEPEFGIVHFDAHTDAGPIRFDGDVHHGNVFSHIAKLARVRHVLRIGCRGLQPHGVIGRVDDLVSIPRLRAMQPGALAALCIPGLPYYLSIDVDVLDPSAAPGTPACEPDGLQLRELRDAIATVSTGRMIIGADVMEVMPAYDRDPAGLTPRAAAQLAIQAIAALLS